MFERFYISSIKDAGMARAKGILWLRCWSVKKIYNVDSNAGRNVEILDARILINFYFTFAANFWFCLKVPNHEPLFIGVSPSTVFSPRCQISGLWG